MSDVDGYGAKYGISPTSRLLQYDFVLMTDEETRSLCHEKATQALEKQGITGVNIIDGLPVPDVD